MQKRNKSKGTINILLIITVFFTGTAALLMSVRVCMSVVQNHAGAAEYKNISAQYVEDIYDKTTILEKNTTYAADEDLALKEVTGIKEDEQIHFPYQVDFASLKTVNPDIAAWIILPGTEIDYPVMFNGDNTFYLSHTFEKKASHTGAIFIDGACIPDFSTTCTIIYGHNISGKTGTMFRTLTEYKEQSFADNNPYLWLAAPDKNYRLDVFACMTTKAVSEPYNIDFTDDTDIQSWLEYLNENSLVKTDVETGIRDRYVILSTCSYEFYNARTIVAAKIVPCKD